MDVARDIMEQQVVRVGINQRVMDVCRMFYQEEISGAPVIDESSQVVGVISLTDLVRTAQSEHEVLTGSSNFYRQIRAAPPLWLDEGGEFAERLDGTRVGEVMTSEVVSVTPDTPIPMVVKKVLEHRVHRVLVLDESSEVDHLAGIISLFDLVKLLE